MKTNLKTLLFKIIISVTSVLIVAGLAVGITCHFTDFGYFNFSGDMGNSKTVSVTYSVIDFNGIDADEKIAEISDNAFSQEGIAYYHCSQGETSLGGETIFTFSSSTESSKIEAAVTIIIDSLQEFNSNNSIVVNYQFHNPVLVWGNALMFASIAVASIAVFQFIYFLIRFKLMMALTAFIANVHNLALFLSVLALARIPIGSNIITLSVMVVVVTFICTAFYFDKVRKNSKDEDLKSLTAVEKAQKSAKESFKLNLILPLALAGATAIILILNSLSAMSIVAVLSPLLAAIAGFAVCAYGCSLVTPAIYERLPLAFDKNHIKKSKKPSQSLLKTEN